MGSIGTLALMERARYALELREQQRVLVKACKLLKRQRDALLEENYQLKQQLAERGRD